MSERVYGFVPSVTRSRLCFDLLLKRALDVTASLVALALLAPFFGLIAIAIKRDSPGPVVYRGARVGRGGKVFRILKFRTMYESLESYAGPKVTACDDPRVTPFGRWLRSTKVNEFLQFWNVLKGDMSLVGPRPEDPGIAEKWPESVREEILSVRPGITSPASVVYRNEEALFSVDNVFRRYVQDVAPNKMRLDQLYVQHRSFCLDIDTLLWTALILVPTIRSSDPPERLLFVGPFTHLVRRYLSWFAADSLIALVAVAFAGGVWRIYAPLNMGWPKAVASAVALALLFGITGALFGINRIDWSKARPDDVYEVVAAWLVAAVAAFAFHLFAHVLPLGVVAMASLLALCGFVVFRYRSRLVTGALSRIVRYRARKSGTCERVLIIGSGRNAEYAAWLLHRPSNAPKYQLVGFVDDDLFSHGMRVYGADVLGASRDVPDLVVKHEIDVVILADHCITLEQQNAISDFCRATNKRLVAMPDTGDSLTDPFRFAVPVAGTGTESRETGDVRRRENPAERGTELVSPLRQSDTVEVA